MQSESICVLFLCTGNSARSQMAEALLCDLGGARFIINSAGLEPAARVAPAAVTVLAEIGLDWSKAEPKSVSQFAGQSFDYVITLCEQARSSCPTFPGQHALLHWDLEDPAAVGGSAEERLEAFRRTRQELTHHLGPFIEMAIAAHRKALAV
jgi:arsenate reductase